MKRGVMVLSEREFENKLMTANLFAHSYLSFNDSLIRFNALTINMVRTISNEFKRLDEKRKVLFPKYMPKDTLNELHNQSVLVDANVLAAEFDIDPLVIMMCIVFQDEQCRSIIVK